MVLCRALTRTMDDPKKATSIYDFTAKDIDGNEVKSQNETQKIMKKKINQSKQNLFLGESVKIQGTRLCHRQCGLKVRKD